MCEKCQDKGFIEEEHGLIMIFCDCEKGKALRAEVTGEIADATDIDSRIGQPNSADGSGDTSQPIKPRKQKRKRAK